MASRIIPGISLRAFWDLGESGWKAGMDENIWRLSFLVQSRVLGVVETLPPGPAEGDRYILNNDASPYDQHIMVYDQALWVPIVPEDRFVVFNTENDSLMYFNLAGNTWVSLISPEAIKEAYESNPNTNEFTDDEKAKLSDIEDNATADMTAEEIKTAYESNPNSNAFTDAEKAKLSGLSSSRFLGVYPTIGSLQSSHPAPAEGSFGYVDGGPLLDILCYIWDANSVKYVLQASAGGMETPESIKTKYESNEDTNAFTDAEKVKLALIDPDEPGPEGPQGLSAYQVAVANGFVGTEVEWLTSLIGAQGDDGADGKSAYEIAVENGFVGTISEWLVSLIGSPGTNGTDGTDGINGNDGADGLSAYEVALANGFVGTEAAWLASLVGAPGTDGTDGVDGTDGLDGNAGTSAYDVAVANGFVGDEAAWLSSLVGADGTDGADGKTILNGAGAPAGGTGTDGDFYINTTLWEIYGPKTAGAWGSPTALIDSSPVESIILAVSDETTALAAGTTKVTFRMPYAFTLTGIRGSLTTAQTSGSILTVDVNEGGTSILSTKLTIDNTEKTSTTAATAAVISDASLADDAEITIDIDQIGDGTAKGLKTTLIGFRPHSITPGTPVAPTVRSSNRAVQNTSGTTSGAVSSGSPVSGDLIILHIAHGTNLAIGTPITWPSGFTEGGRVKSGRASGAWAWKVAGGSEPSTYTATWSTGNTCSILSCVVVKDQNGLDTAFVNTADWNTSVLMSGSTTATTDPCLRLYFYAGGWGGGTLTVTPATTSPACSLILAGVMTSAGSDATGAGSFVISKEELTTTLAQITHNISWTLNSDGMHYTAFTIPIKRL